MNEFENKQNNLNEDSQTGANTVSTTNQEAVFERREVHVNTYNQTPVAESIPGKNKAIASLVLGISACVVPIPFLDLICGIIGILLAIQSKKVGFQAGIRTAGFVVSIVGTVFSVFYTLWWIIVLISVISAPTLFSDIFMYL